MLLILIENEIIEGTITNTSSRTRRQRGDSDICVPAQRCIRATVSCLPLVWFHSQPPSHCQARLSLLSTRCPQHIADTGLAPKLYGYAAVKGAPTAYVMEHLNPSVWQTLYQLLKPEDKPTNQLQDALEKIIAALDEKKYVHGDLRSNNIMVRTDVMDKYVDLKVIDFDWAGNAGQVHHPAERNREIQWPGEAGGPIEQDHDLKMVDSWMKDLP